MFFKKDYYNPWDRNRDKSPSRSQGSSPGNSVDDFIDKVTSILKTKSYKNHGSNGSKENPPAPPFSKKWLFFAGIGGIGLWLLSGFYKVEEGSIGVVLRFGEMVRMASSGLQYHLPSPIEQVIVQNISGINRIDGTLKGDSGEPSDKTLILTGDENMIHTNFTVLWKIKSVGDFLFTARDPVSTIRTAAESCVREVIGQTSARLVLTEGRSAIEIKTQELLQKLMDEYRLGVTIFNVQLQRVEAPSQVIEAFYDVQSSLVDASRLENEAEAFRNDVLPRARGEAVQYIEEAKAEKAKKVNMAQGQAGRFKLLLAAYQKNPLVTKKRYYLETLNAMLQGKSKIIVDRAAQGIVPYLPLDKLQQVSERLGQKKENEKKEGQ